MSTIPAIEGGIPVRDTFLPFFKVQLGNEEIQEVVDTLKSGWLTTGPKVKKFTERFKEYIGAGYAVGLNSCTAGLFLGLKLLDLEPGSEVITTPLTFAATANVIIHCGFVPVFVDVNRATFNIDPGNVERAITSKTGAILPVHLFGRACEMEDLLAIKKKSGVPILADAAHAIETEWQGSKVGGLTDLSAYSFYATKNVITGEGGMLTFSNKNWFERVTCLRLHGMSRDAWKRYAREGTPLYDIVIPGYKMNMTDIQAALGLHQLEHVETRWKYREKLWNLYQKELNGLPIIKPADPEPGTRHGYHIYNVLLQLEMLKKSRNEIMAVLQAENIGTGFHFPVLHLTSYYSSSFGFKKGDFPNAEWISDRTISLPFSPYMTENDVMDVVEACKKALTYYRR